MLVYECVYVYSCDLQVQFFTPPCDQFDNESKEYIGISIIIYMGARLSARSSTPPLRDLENSFSSAAVATACNSAPRHCCTTRCGGGGCGRIVIRPSQNTITRKRVIIIPAC